jgi:hypothetical protein
VVKQKYIQWFRQGAHTLRAVARERGLEDAFPTGEDWYLCPLCIDVLLTVEEFKTGQLTVEHAPPGKLGGKELVLTCKDCNSDQGSKFDGEAVKQQQLAQLFSGQRAETARFTLDGIKTGVEMHVTGQKSMLLISPHKIYNPAMEEHMRMLGETPSADFRFTVQPQLRYSPDRARVSWIRTSYLAAFALFGWKYILQQKLQPIRDQLANPSAVMLPLLYMYDAGRAPGRHEVWVVRAPAEHRSLLVVWGGHGVFLPLPKDPRSLEELARSLGVRADGPVHYSITGTMIPWPSRPQYLLDPDPISG